MFWCSWRIQLPQPNRLTKEKEMKKHSGEERRKSRKKKEENRREGNEDEEWRRKKKTKDGEEKWRKKDGGERNEAENWEHNSWETIKNKMKKDDESRSGEVKGRVRLTLRRKKQVIYKVFCCTRTSKWDTQWDLKSLVRVCYTHFWYYQIYPTPLLGNDMTQGQYLGGV